MTSAVRDAANGAEFAAAVRDRYGLDARTLSGDEEARLTFLGATAARDRGDPTPLLVIDIGGGSTELVVGARGEVDFHVSTQVGVVRHSERHLHSDPPPAAELEALAADARGRDRGGVPAAVRERAGGGRRRSPAPRPRARRSTSSSTRTTRARVEGHVLSRERLEELRDRLAALPLAERRDVTGLTRPRADDRGRRRILLEVLGAFGLDRVEVSERDILWGVALDSTNLR